MIIYCDYYFLFKYGVTCLSLVSLDDCSYFLHFDLLKICRNGGIFLFRETPVATVILLQMIKIGLIMPFPLPILGVCTFLFICSVPLKFG